MEPETSHLWPREFIDRHLNAESRILQRWAFEHLEQLHDAAFPAFLFEVLSDRTSPIIDLAVRSCRNGGYREYALPILRIFRESSGFLRSECALSLGAFQFEEALPDLLKVIQKRDFQDVPGFLGTVRGLSAFHTDEAYRALHRLLDEGDTRPLPESIRQEVFGAVLNLEGATLRRETIATLIQSTEADPEEAIEYWFPVLRRYGNATYLAELLFLCEIQAPAVASSFAEYGGFAVGLPPEKVLHEWDALIEEGAFDRLFVGLATVARHLKADGTCALLELIETIAEPRWHGLLSAGGARMAAIGCMAALFSVIEDRTFPEEFDEFDLAEYLDRDLFLSPQREETLREALCNIYCEHPCIREMLHNHIRRPGIESPLVRSLYVLSRTNPRDLLRCLPGLFCEPRLSGVTVNALLEVARELGPELLRRLTPLPRRFPETLYEDILELAADIPHQASVDFVLAHFRTFKRRAPQSLAHTIERHGCSRYLSPLREQLQRAPEEHLSSTLLFLEALHGERSSADMDIQTDALLSASEQLLARQPVAEANDDSLTLRCRTCGLETVARVDEILVDPDTMEFLLPEDPHCSSCSEAGELDIAASSKATLLVEWAGLIAQGRTDAGGEGHHLRLCSFTIDGKRMGPQRAREYVESQLRNEPADPQNLLRLGRIYDILRRRPQASACLDEALRLDDHYAEADYLLGCLARSAKDTSEMLRHFQRVRELHEQGTALWGSTNPRPILDDIYATLRTVRPLVPKPEV